MTRTRQVRLEPDVVALIEADPDLGGSLSARANEAIRRTTGDVTQSSVASSRPDPAPIRHPGPRRPPVVSVRDLARRSTGRTGRPDPGLCGHPVARRIGSRCGACGGDVTS